MSQIILNRGIPGSGKTTDSMNYLTAGAAGFTVRLSRDDDRLSKFGFEGVGNSAQEQLITDGHLAQAKIALDKGWDVLVDATHLNDRAIQPWRKLAANRRVPLTFWDHHVRPDVAILRDAERERTVGAEVIMRLAKRGKVDMSTGALPPANDFTPPEGPDLTPVVWDDLLPTAWLVDTDGTVADHRGVRNPYDTNLYHLDKPHQDVINLVTDLSEIHHIIGVSGRSEDHRQVTLDWWRSNVRITPDEFYMRPSKDQRPDDVIKAEIYEQKIRGKYNIAGVLDDRGRVLRMWRAKGLTTFAVGDTDNNDF